MQFRPCIDIHNGQVKQIVGASLKDEGDEADENYRADHDSAYYARLYRENSLKGGHVILLNGKESPYYKATKAEALKALKAYPGGLQVGGGINDLNAGEFLAAGASHVIVTSYVFSDGKICYNKLEKLCDAVGKDHIVLDVSTRKRDDRYYVVTDRWQRFTDTCFEKALFDRLSDYCDEFLVHAVDVEGKKSGIDETVLDILSECGKTVTYAGGIASLDDIELIRRMGKDKVNFTVGSALDIFGGVLGFSEVVKCIR